MESTQIITASGREVRVGVIPVGINFGYVGIVKARNGRIIHETPDCYPFPEGALRVAEDWAAKA